MSQNIGPLAGGSTAPETYVDGDDEVDAAVFEWNDITGTSDHPTGSQSTQPTRQNKVKKPDTKSVKGTDDPLYSDDKEDPDSRNSGTKLCPTLPKVTRPCFAKDDVDRTKKMVRCLYSAHCKQVWKTWPRDKTRVLRHASKCGFLAHHEDKGLAQEVLRELAVVDPKFAAQLKLNFPPPGGSKRSRSVDKEESHTVSAVTPLKRSRTEPTIGSKHGGGVQAADKRLKPTNPTMIYKAEGQKQLENHVNHTLVKLFVCCGIPPNVLSSTEFKEFCGAMNARYAVPSRSRLEESLIPLFAVQVRLSVMERLQRSRNLTISFDGGKLSKKKFFSVHVTEESRESVCLELDDSSRLSMTGDYIVELLRKVGGYMILIVVN